jgi:hypothetical protein
MPPTSEAEIGWRMPMSDALAVILNLAAVRHFGKLSKTRLKLVSHPLIRHGDVEDASA